MDLNCKKCQMDITIDKSFDALLREAAKKYK